LEQLSKGKGKLAEVSEEGQGPRRAVEPMMMMMILTCHPQVLMLRDGQDIYIGETHYTYNILIVKRYQKRLRGRHRWIKTEL
jgi:hypothetical protein